MAVSPTDPHPGVVAHEIAARHITDFLIASVLPKLTGPSTRKTIAPRTTEQITAAAVQHMRELLEMEPNCMAARIWLDRVRMGM